ncbi:MAG: hypothetical protein H0T73_15045, partial [Ardenticatenales bacterium]|nr:hypothetical protein [Ardenticatenales bacterium]
PYFPPLLDTLKPEEATDWIAEHFNLSASEGIGSDYRGALTVFVWEKDGRHFKLWFHNNQLFQLSMTTDGLTGSKIMECLGPPAFYIAEEDLSPHDGFLVFLSFHYPEKGMRISTVTPRENYIGAETYFQSFTYGPAGSVEDNIRMRGLSGPNGPPTEDEIQAMVARLRPWPGRWKDIIVDP